MAVAVARIAYLDGTRLSRGFLAGIARVIADADRLNRINVFPVPDGDTGSNLAVMLGTVRAVLLRQRERHAGRLLERVADAALDGARGNSGAILAQFLHGASDASRDLHLLTATSFVDAVNAGAGYAQDAVSEPRDGTMLTVMRDFGAELSSGLSAGGHDLAGLLEGGLRRAQESLAGTTAQIEVLSRAGVVDAGGQGFVDLLEGIADYVRRGSLRPDLEAAETQDVVDGAETFSRIDATEPDHRWCTECIISAPTIDRRALREALAGIGSSLVIAGGKSRVRIHIHADEPEEVFHRAAAFGDVETKKADDMRSQRAAARRGANKVGIITDSAADIPEELLQSLDIHMVPARVHFGARSYLDKIDLDATKFYLLMEQGTVHPTTSQPPPGDFRRLYQVLGSHHAGVLSIHLTAWGSGTFQAAATAAERCGRESRVRVLDSRNVSIGQGLIVLRAAELAAAGWSLGEIEKALEHVRSRTRTWALLGSLEHAVRGGRVAPSKLRLARFLRLEPILATFPDGRIGGGGVMFGRHNRAARFARWIARRANRGEGLRLAVGHANAPEAAAELHEHLRALLPRIEDSFVIEIGIALGVHGGPGTLVVAMQARELPSR